MDDKQGLEKSRWWLGMALVLAVIIYVTSMNWRGFGGTILDWRWEILLCLGVLTWVLMSLSMVFPLRWRWVGKLTGGLDKSYGIHKWAGIAALAVALFHWLTVQTWRWMPELGLVDGMDPGVFLSGVLDRLGSGGTFPLDPISRLGGGGAFFIMAAVVAVALIKRIPYDIFRAIHKLAPVVYLLGCIHVLNRIPRDWWGTPAAWILAVLTAAGIYGAVVALSQAIGKKHRVKARIASMSVENGDTIDLVLETEKPLPHKSGQFAFLDFTGKHHGGHPFSMASYDKSRLRFLIKQLGDTTGILDRLLEPDSTVEVEGPYGRFNFEDKRPVQVWIAGGIGITPFMGRLEELAAEGGSKGRVHFWYSVDNEEEARFPSGLAELCMRAGVSLYTVISDKDERLDADEVEKTVDDLALCSVWFCGPAGFRDGMRSGLFKKGFSPRHFHSEMFEMR